MGYNKKGEVIPIHDTDIVMDSLGGGTLKDAVTDKKIGVDVKNTLSGGETTSPPSVAAVNSGLAAKADKATLDSAVSTLNNSLASKATTAEVAKKANKTDVDSALAGKMNNTTFKTVNGNSLIGSGNIQIDGTVSIDTTLPSSPVDTKVPSTKLLKTQVDTLTAAIAKKADKDSGGAALADATSVTYTDGDTTTEGNTVADKLTELEDEIGHVSNTWEWETLDESQLLSGTWKVANLANYVVKHTVELQSASAFSWYWRKLYAEDDGSNGIFPKANPIAVGDTMGYVYHSTSSTGGGRGLADVCKKGDVYYVQGSKPADARPLVWAINESGVYTIAIYDLTAENKGVAKYGRIIEVTEDGYIFFNFSNDTMLVKKRMLMPTEVIADEMNNGKGEGVYTRIPSQVAFGDIPTLWYRNQLGSDNSSYQDLCLEGQEDVLDVSTILSAWQNLPNNANNHGHLTVEQITDADGNGMYDSTGNYPILRAHWKPLIYSGEYGKKPIKIIITAAAQGQEQCSCCGLYYLLKDMLENCEKHPVLDYLATHVEFVFYPVVCPNGCNPTPSYYNANSVNINRNYPTNSWDSDHAKLVAYLEELAEKQKEPDYSPSADEQAMNEKVQTAYDHCGEKGGDQAETKAVVYDVMTNHSDALIFIDYHTCGNVQAVSWANTNWWIIPHGDNIMTDAIRDAAKEYFPALNHYTRRDYPMTQTLSDTTHIGTSSESDIEYTHLGGSDAWADEQGFIGMIIEGHNGFYQDESYNVGNRGQKHCSEIIANVLMYILKNLKRYSI